MDQSTTPKRKPGRPRKAKPNAGAQNTQTPSNPSEANPLEATIKAARSAYEPSNQPRGPIVPRGTDKGEVTAMGDDRLGMGAVTLPPLPPLRVRGELSNPGDWVKSLSEAQVEAFATAWIATGKRTKWLFQNSDQFGRENASTRGAILRELEAHPVCKLTVARLTDEIVMSDLERRKRLKDIAASAPHELRGFADNLKAIELDAKHDPESVENKRKDNAANSLTFNAPVSLFFMPSTQARAIPQQAEAIEVATLPTPQVGGTPGT